MLKKYWVLCALVILIAVPGPSTQGQDGKAIVSAVAKAMGAENLKTVQLTGTGSNAAGIGQNFNPTRSWPMVRVNSYTHQIGLDALASNVQAVRIQHNTESPRTPGIAPN